MKHNFKKILMISCSIILIFSSINPIIMHANSLKVKGCDKGPSYIPVVPMKQTTFVAFDENSLLDDYAFLASIPTAAFQHEGIMYSHPLLYYQNSFDYEHEYEKPLDARQGLDYFMEDWMSYCHGTLDEMTLINVPKNKVNQWDANKYTTLSSNNPYELASSIALNEWSYSDTAVVAVINEKYENPNQNTHGTLRDHLNTCEIGMMEIQAEKPIIGTGATYQDFEINDKNYKYVIAKMSWDGKFDYDLQIYDNKLGMVQASANSFKQAYPWYELVGSYIHNYGKWETSVSAVAKKSSNEETGPFEKMCYYPTPKSTGISALFDKNMIDISIALLPGKIIEIESTPYGCSDVEFTLSWDDPGVNLGFTILDPTNTEIASTFSLEEVAMKYLALSSNATSSENNNEVTINLDKLGECDIGENYSICVFSLKDIGFTTDFTFRYQWTQNISRIKGDCLESASNAAVLASSLNSPLLYTNSSTIPSTVKNALYKLGVNTIYLINIGSHANLKVINELDNIASIHHYEKVGEIYNAINEITDKKDVIFSTIDSWTYWYMNERKPAGKQSHGYHFGPAAYIAAHHGSPVIIVDNHPELSQAIMYSTNMWRNGGAVDREIMLPSAGAMVKSVRRAYQYLERYGFGSIEQGGSEEQDKETIITVAGQFDIGIPWDRAFTGAGLNGRFWGSPVDSAYSICRNMFYPSLIFINPAMNTVTLTQGSESTIKKIGGRIQKPLGSTLVITEPMKEEKFEYPVLQSYLTYAYRYNEESWKHFNCKYARADGIIPWDTPSPDPIDDGAAHGKSGAYYPDISESEVIPFYCDKAGYDNVFSSSFEAITNNLNQGVLYWCVQIHGHHYDGGNLEIWSVESPYVNEENPWRSYEPIALKLGNFDEFIPWIGYYLSHHFDNELLTKISNIPTFPIELFTEHGSTENPDVAFLNPQLTTLATIASPIQGVLDVWGPWPFMIYRDRVMHPIQTIRQGLPFINWADGDGKSCHSPPTGGRLVGSQKNGVDFDEALVNLHCCGINSISCFPANTYLHLTWMRHGTAYQIIDPWSTTDWAGIWNQMLIKYFAMGYTVGEAYERGIRACGPLYSVGQWWWDLWQNICFYGDPNLRPFVPNTEYTDIQNGYLENYWTYDEVQPLYFDNDLNVNGHMPFGASAHPHEREPLIFGEYTIPLFALIAVIILLIFVILFPGRKEK